MNGRLPCVAGSELVVFAGFSKPSLQLMIELLNLVPQLTVIFIDLLEFTSKLKFSLRNMDVTVVEFLLNLADLLAILDFSQLFLQLGSILVRAVI